jgi:hypothetical protein
VSLSLGEYMERYYNEELSGSGSQNPNHIPVQVSQSPSTSQSGGINTVSNGSGNNGCLGWLSYMWDGGERFTWKELTITAIVGVVGLWTGYQMGYRDTGTTCPIATGMNAIPVIERLIPDATPRHKFQDRAVEWSDDFVSEGKHNTELTISPQYREFSVNIAKAGSDTQDGRLLVGKYDGQRTIVSYDTVRPVDCIDYLVTEVTNPAATPGGGGVIKGTDGKNYLLKREIFSARPSQVVVLEQYTASTDLKPSEDEGIYESKVKELVRGMIGKSSEFVKAKEKYKNTLKKKIEIYNNQNHISTIDGKTWVRRLSYSHGGK